MKQRPSIDIDEILGIDDVLPIDEDALLRCDMSIDSFNLALADKNFAVAKELLQEYLHDDRSHNAELWFNSFINAYVESNFDFHILEIGLLKWTENKIKYEVMQKAIDGGKVVMVESLLNQHSDYKKYINYAGETFLHLAAYSYQYNYMFDQENYAKIAHLLYKSNPNLYLVKNCNNKIPADIGLPTSIIQEHAISRALLAKAGLFSPKSIFNKLPSDVMNEISLKILSFN